MNDGLKPATGCLLCGSELVPVLPRWRVRGSLGGTAWALWQAQREREQQLVAPGAVLIAVTSTFCGNVLGPSGNQVDH